MVAIPFLNLTMSLLETWGARVLVAAGFSSEVTGAAVGTEAGPDPGLEVTGAAVGTEARLDAGLVE